MTEIKFGGYFGLFVYDTKKQEFLRSVDLSSIGCQHTQGDEACEIHVTEDGSIVYLCPMNMNFMYAYLVSENKILRMSHDLVGIEMYQGLEGELVCCRTNTRNDNK